MGDFRRFLPADADAAAVVGADAAVSEEDELFEVPTPPLEEHVDAGQGPFGLVLRAAGPGELDVELTVNGSGPRQWHAALAHGMSLASIPIDSQPLDSDRVEIQLKARRPYTSYHYWLLQ